MASKYRAGALPFAEADGFQSGYLHESGSTPAVRFRIEGLQQQTDGSFILEGVQWRNTEKLAEAVGAILMHEEKLGVAMAEELVDNLCKDVRRLSLARTLAERMQPAGEVE